MMKKVFTSTLFFTLLLTLYGSNLCLGNSIKYQFQPPNSGDNEKVGVTPNLPNDFFRSQVVVPTFNPVADHHLDRPFTYIFEISGADLCQTITIVGLEYCYRERNERLGENRTLFDFFPLRRQSSNILDLIFTVRAISELTPGNCTSVPSRSTSVCCSYQPLLSLPTLTDVSHFGITNIQDFPTLLRLPDPYNASHYVQSRSINNDIQIPQSPDLRTFLKNDGHVPSFRLYFKCPPSNLTMDTPTGLDTSSTIMSHSVTDTSSITDDPINLSADSNVTEILIYAGIAAGCFLFVVITIAVAALAVTRLSQSKKTRRLSKMPASQEQSNDYNTLNTIKPLQNPHQYSTLDQEWLPNSAYLSNTQTGNHELQPIQVRHLQPHRNLRHSEVSVTTANNSDTYYSSIKPVPPPRRAEHSFQSNVAYHDNVSPSGQDPVPLYSNTCDRESDQIATPQRHGGYSFQSNIAYCDTMSPTELKSEPPEYSNADQNLDHTPYYATPKYTDVIEEEADC